MRIQRRPGRPQRHLLRLRGGQVVCDRRQVGRGKSTLADALLAMLPISAGAIRINGIPLSTIEEASLRARIILVDSRRASSPDPCGTT